MATYRFKCRLVQIITSVLILALPFFNILRLDIPTLRFYFFDSVLWVNEFHLLFLVGMLILWIIVFFSMLYGRVWCGWMCPQMILVIMVHWFEERGARLLKYRSGRSGPVKRLLHVTLVAFVVAALSLLVGFNLVSYFVDPYRMLAGLNAGFLSTLEGQFVLGIGIFMFVNLMFWQERFCTRVCPYGMMQVLVTDSKTQIIRYQKERTDDCLDCTACVKGCLMGIDIRTTPYQTECVYCGDCVDVCSGILTRKNKPGLITFSWGEEGARESWYEKLGLVDAKRWIILGLTVLFTTGLVALVHARQPLSISVQGDRSTLFRQEADDFICNDYTVIVENRSLEKGVFRIDCTGPGIGPGDIEVLCEKNPLPLESRESRTLKMSLRTRGESLHQGPNRLVLSLKHTEKGEIAIDTEVVFFMPEDQIRLIPESN